MEQLVSTATPKVTRRHYTKREIKALEPFIKGHMSVNGANLRTFCEAYDRKFTNVQAFIYREKSERKNRKPANPQTTGTKEATVNFKKVDNPVNSMKIAVKNFNISQENGQLFLTINY